MVDSTRYISVSDLNYYIMQKFKNDPYLHQIFLKGELSNFRYRRNSHQYFSLKDEKAKINVVMFRSNFDKLNFKPEEGMKVYISGYVSVYGPQGTYQFYAQTMEPAGLGALYEQLQQLKEKLAKEGLFETSHRKSLPRFPDKIAVVTSASGAVIHDIMVTANRRFPHAEIDLFPAQVQGENAKESLVGAMQQIAARGDDYDVMIIGRGGGSLEDLWPFNEEAVVRQVNAMTMPVISSVGHETDTTLCDLVADVRAATPTAAAEYATPNVTDELIRIRQFQTQLIAGIEAIIRDRKQRLARVNQSIVMREPTRLYDQQVQTLDLLIKRLSQAGQQQVAQREQKLTLMNQRLFSASPAQEISRQQQTRLFLIRRLKNGMISYLKDKKNALGLKSQELDGVSPLKALARGFVYTTQENGKTVTSAMALSKGSQVIMHFKDGQAKATVSEIKRNEK